MEEDFKRQQIDVKRQCFHVNDLKMFLSIFQTAESHISQYLKMFLKVGYNNG